jgi:MoxR-like ATPase
MQEDHRNPMTALTDLDKKEELQGEVRTTSPTGRSLPTLREFVEDLRHRIARGVEDRTLYYTKRDIRSFLGGLAMTRLLLLQGLSGTGKTSLPLAFHSAIRGGIEVVKVQAGWRDRQDLIGYYNAFHRHYYASNFLQALYKAGTPAYQDRPFMMVLDEINLSRPEQFFADFLSELEQPIHDRKITLVDDPVANAPRLMVDGRHLPIPPNVWFVGTANHDETTAAFADKTYDRAHVMEIRRKGKQALFEVEDRNRRNPLSYTGFQRAFADAADKQSKAVAKATTWLEKAPFADTLARRFRVGWGNRLEDQLGRYLPVVVEAGGSVGEAMDHLLETKVMRKLKDRHDVRAAALEDLQEQLLTAWDKLDKSSPPERCDALIQAEIDAKKDEDLV